jgi:hypothetical protein
VKRFRRTLGCMPTARRKNDRRCWIGATAKVLESPARQESARRADVL